MYSHKWVKDKYGDFMYGLITDNDLRNTKGVYISANGDIIYIGHFNQDGGPTKPYIYRDNNYKFVIHE